MQPHPSIEHFLILMQACCHWHVTGGLADFVPPRAIIGHHVCKGHQSPGSVSGPARTCLCVCVSVNVNMHGHTVVKFVPERKKALYCTCRYLNVMKGLDCVTQQGKTVIFFCRKNFGGRKVTADNDVVAHEAAGSFHVLA